jgi:hypothetical protein
VFIQYQCSEADRLDELFSGVRETARRLAMTGELSKISETELEEQEHAVLNQIHDHQIICGCGSPNQTREL